MKTVFLLISFLHFACASYYYEYGEKVEIIDTKKRSILSDTNIEHYKTKTRGDISFRKNQIIVKCNKNANCEDDFISLDLANFQEISKSFYLIKITNKQNIFDICKKLYEKKDIQIAHPNYITNAKRR